MPKNVFISWSGNVSHKVATLLYSWLPRFVQSIDPFLSSEDIRKGARWFGEISAELEEVNFGIVCVAPNNINAPWLLFEAGALSKSLGQSRVSPVLINVTNSELQGPLAQFNNTVLTREDLKKLIESVNLHLGDKGIRSDLLDQTFEICWPVFEKELNDALAYGEKANPVTQVRSQPDMLDELLQLTRNISQQLQVDRTDTKVPASSITEGVANLSTKLDELKDKEKLVNLINTVSHELLAAIVGVRANASFLRLKLDQLPRELVDIKFNDILADCELLLFQVDELRYALGDRPLPRRVEPVSVFRDVIIKTINQLKPLLIERGIHPSSIQFRQEDIHKIRITADKSRLQQVIFNLLINAIKYGEADPEEFRINIIVDETPQNFIVKFQDWGIGIADADRQRIFEQGFRGKEAIERSVTGSGLGLTIAQALMQEIGGDVKLTNNAKPTEFQLILPKSPQTRGPGTTSFT